MQTDEREQTVMLQTALKVVRDQGMLMQRAMDGDNLKVTLDYATEMLRELRSSTLTPRNYYELYMSILDQLRHLEEYFSQLQRNGTPIVNIYEQVQSCGNVVPRLYLLCCVGGVYIQSMEAPAKDVLRDLVEMLKGVQHPMRGLFLRNYLTLVSKNKLPDAGSPYEGAGGTVQDAYNFILLNFAETNRLWVRLQTQKENANGKNKKAREAERQDLRILVGANLVRLSQLEGLDVIEYKERVLPTILEEIVNCKDTIAQTYLMDCLIQVFPDEFHLATLQQFLEVVTSLKEKVNVRAIIEAMSDRLCQHVSEGHAIPAEIPVFRILNDATTSVIEDRANMPLLEALKLQTSLVNFSLKAYTSRSDFISHCMETCAGLIEKTDFLATREVSPEAAAGTRSIDDTTLQIEALLLAPLSVFALKVLEVPAYVKLMSYLPWGNWREVASTLMRSVVKTNTVLSEIEQVDQLFQALVPLLVDKEGVAPPTDEDGALIPPDEIFIAEQQLMARSVHLMKHDDTDSLLQIYVNARTHFQTGGPQRIQFTIPPLVLGALALTRRVRQRELASSAEPPTAEKPHYSSRKILLHILENIKIISNEGHKEEALQLYLLAAKAADECGLNMIAYELFKEAPIIYEEEIIDSKKQVRALTSMIGNLATCVNFNEEQYDILATKLGQYSNKLLKKSDQCKMVSLCSHLFWPSKMPDGTHRFADQPAVYEHSLKCMKRAIKVIKDKNMPSSVVEVLDRYVYHLQHENPEFEAKYLSGLIAFINEEFGADLANSPAVENHYRNILDFILLKQQHPATAERFRQIAL